MTEKHPSKNVLFLSAKDVCALTGPLDDECSSQDSEYESDFKAEAANVLHVHS